MRDRWLLEGGLLIVLGVILVVAVTGNIEGGLYVLAAGAIAGGILVFVAGLYKPPIPPEPKPP